MIQLCWACGRDTYDQPIPPAFFQDIVLDITFPEYVRLRTDGGTYEINDKGIKGVIIYRKSSGNYLAYEKNCSYHPADACSTVQVDASGLYMIDYCCGSSFSLDTGTPIGGPAWRPLRQYRTIMDIALLTITSESLNGM